MAKSTSLISLLQSGQFLSLKPNCNGGLILQKGFYAEFVGAGAAVGGCFDIKSTTIYAAGRVQFYAPQTYAERRQAFQTRMAYLSKLQQITLEPSPAHRAYFIIRQLSKWLNAEEIKKIPHELVARLVGVQPETVAISWHRHFLKAQEKVLSK